MLITYRCVGTQNISLLPLLVFVLNKSLTEHFNSHSSDIDILIPQTLHFANKKSKCFGIIHRNRTWCFTTFEALSEMLRKPEILFC